MSKAQLLLSRENAAMVNPYRPQLYYLWSYSYEYVQKHKAVFGDLTSE